MPTGRRAVIVATIDTECRGFTTVRGKGRLHRRHADLPWSLSVRRGLGAQHRFEFSDAMFESLDHLTGTQQHAALYVELFARDQIEPAQARAQGVLEIRRQVIQGLARGRAEALARFGGNEIGQASSQVVERGDGNHGVTSQANGGAQRTGESLANPFAAGSGSLLTLL